MVVSHTNLVDSCEAIPQNESVLFRLFSSKMITQRLVDYEKQKRPSNERMEMKVTLKDFLAHHNCIKRSWRRCTPHSANHIVHATDDKDWSQTNRFGQRDFRPNDISYDRRKLLSKCPEYSSQCQILLKSTVLYVIMMFENKKMTKASLNWSVLKRLDGITVQSTQ